MASMHSGHVALHSRHYISLLFIYYLLFIHYSRIKCRTLFNRKRGHKWGHKMGAKFKLSISYKNRKVTHVIHELQTRGLNVSDVLCKLIQEGFNKEIKRIDRELLLQGMVNQPKSEFFE